LLHNHVIVFMPGQPNPDKMAVIQALGAEIRLCGSDFDVCKAEATRWAEEQGLFFLDDGANPDLMAGAGTVALEIVADLPDVEAIFVPVGNGALAASTGIVAKSQPVPPRVIAVQAEGAPSMYLSWKERRLVETERAETFAEGLATRVPVPFATEILQDVVDEFVLLSDIELRRSIRLMFEATHNVAEGAGAAALAGLMRDFARYRNRRVALVLSGGNITADNLAQALIGTGLIPSMDMNDEETLCDPMVEPSMNSAE
jgi:threonine dehydratase